ncbi:MAG: hypothetical protein ACE5FB_07985, partial [Candidatus Binatia bacterium]
MVCIGDFPYAATPEGRNHHGTGEVTIEKQRKDLTGRVLRKPHRMGKISPLLRLSSRFGPIEWRAGA